MSPRLGADLGARCRSDDALLEGNNTLEIRVTNLWVNRLVGDKQPGVKPSTFTGVASYRADAPLRRSGLMGPVEIRTFGPLSVLSRRGPVQLKNAANSSAGRALLR